MPQAVETKDLILDAAELLFSENVTEYRNQRGELVVTARGVGVRTERVVES